MKNKVQAPPSKTERDAKKGISREEIETLCLLEVVGRGDATPAELAERLGLPRTLAPAIQEAIQPLVARRHLDARDTGISLTESGRVWLEQRLAELGCA
jgi:hypothetical protein